MPAIKIATAQIATTQTATTQTKSALRHFDKLSAAQAQ
jgi:hypothetical protein